MLPLAPGKNIKPRIKYFSKYNRLRLSESDEMGQFNSHTTSFIKMNENAIKSQHLKILYEQKFYDSLCAFKKGERCTKERSGQRKFVASLDKLR